ncbi:Apm4 protein [Maudiozyma humilis]|uniref:Apm4 protein n=1 Tax=Maudiozyma humilis TaxID=51915 RepID=A0AAV5S587_MAUHU|nr:Apm4 protein [Kazachstania humilis]
MISALLIYTPRGELVVSKFYKGSIKRSITDIFRVQVINSLDVRSPILTLGSTTFHYIRSPGGLWLVTVNRNNINSARVWELLYALGGMLAMYAIDNSDTIKEQFMLVYECLSLMLLETGVVCDTELPSIAKQMSVPPAKPELVSMQQEEAKKKKQGSLASKALPKFLQPVRMNSMTRSLSLSTGSSNSGGNSVIGKKNELVLYVNERINILVAKDSSILKSYVDGTIDLTSHLPPNVSCQFGLNDTQSYNSSGGYGSRIPRSAERTSTLPTSAAMAVDLQNCKFHQCVNLETYERDHVVSFTPPEGTVELMKYHVTEDINLPFKVSPIVTVVSSSASTTSAIDYRISLKSLFPSKLSATDVTLRIPVPPGTIDCKINTSNGSCRFIPEEHAMLWRFNKFQGSTENTLSAITVSSNDTTELVLQQWSRPPIALTFELLMFSNSGLSIRYFDVQQVRDGPRQRTAKWIKYVSKSGAYEIRY